MADKSTSEKRVVAEDVELEQPKAQAPAPAPQQLDVTRVVTEALVAAQTARVTAKPATPNIDVAKRPGGMFIAPGGVVVDANGVALAENDVPAEVAEQAQAVANAPAPATNEGA